MPSQRVNTLARNEVRFRAHNERAKSSNAGHAWVDPPLPDWSCECGWEGCQEPVRMSLAEYEAVRAMPTWFFVLPDDGHVAPDAERVVERHRRYWVVEKVGLAARLAAELDPRTGDAENA
jgi:hypothetical protein